MDMELPQDGKELINDGEQKYLEWPKDREAFWVLAITVLIEMLLMMAKVLVVALVTNEPFEVDAANYTVGFIRNMYLLYHIRRIPEHASRPRHWASSRLVSEAFTGPSSVLLLELTVAAALSVSLEVVALSHGDSGVGSTVVLYFMQCTNFVVLFAVVMMMEQGWSRLHSICKWQQAVQVAFLVYDIVLHIIVMTKKDIDHEFRDFRIASLASLIALRLICYRFFQFKADEPEYSFVNPMHAKLHLH
eukprot:TRINITY_DN44645_c0_g1_i1.p1 TRINITY_DN44645_c0_g1~~TRINITY_DN44645_c0_g1_i1.p1  ORF type:complete len:247 (+),score=61.46 TRINITY_DN44645_c0_g1_i1:179-919(+)